MHRFFRFNRVDLHLLVVLLVFTLSFFIYQNCSLRKALSRCAQGSDSTAVASVSDVSYAQPNNTYNKPSRAAGRGDNSYSSSREIIKNEHYPGPPAKELEPAAPASKIKEPTYSGIALNSVDSAALSHLPNITPALAGRIVKYRKFLGGYYCVEQLQEVYGLSPQRYEKIAPYFEAKPVPEKVQLLKLEPSRLPRHPYLSHSQRVVLMELMKSKPQRITWQQLYSHDSFTKEDSIRLVHYFSFSR